MFTDGVVDAQGDGEPFGDERLSQMVDQVHSLPVGKLIRAIENELCSYTQQGEPVDDVTLLAIKKGSSMMKGS